MPLGQRIAHMRPEGRPGVAAKPAAASRRRLTERPARAAFARGDRGRQVVRRLISRPKPVADVGLVVLGGGVGANGDLLLEPVRKHLAERVPLSAGA